MPITARTDIFKYSFSPCTIEAWNKLPREITQLDSTNQFGKAVSSYIITGRLLLGVQLYSYFYIAVLNIVHILAYTKVVFAIVLYLMYSMYISFCVACLKCDAVRMGK